MRRFFSKYNYIFRNYDTLVLFSFLIFIFFFLFQLDLYSNQEELNQLKKDISNLKDNYKSELKKENDLLNKIDIIDRSILENSKIQKNISKTKNKIANDIANNQIIRTTLQNNIKENIQLIKKDSILIKEIKDNLANRYKILYKKSRTKSDKQLFNILLNINNFQNLNRLLTRKKYFDIIKEYDNKNLKNYEHIKVRLDSTNQVLSNDEILLESKLKLLNEKNIEQKKLLVLEKKEEENFNDKKKERLTLLKNISKNKKLFKRKIAEKEKAAKKVQELISKLEKERKLREEERRKREELEKKQQKEKIALETEKKKKKKQFKINSNFEKSKNNLNWPVKGKVISKFGKFKNPKTKTYTFNSGIEISTKKNTTVKAVSDGEIIKILWLRGYGNTIILEHGKGYYTVYSNLDKILKD